LEEEGQRKKNHKSEEETPTLLKKKKKKSSTDVGGSIGKDFVVSRKDADLRGSGNKKKTEGSLTPTTTARFHECLTSHQRPGFGGQILVRRIWSTINIRKRKKKSGA